MDKPKVLLVPEELGAWLEGMELGNPKRYFTMIESLLYYCKTSMNCSIDKFINENKKELIEVILGSREYKVEEEPLYYALIKGHEIMTDKGNWTFKYWKFDTSNGDVFPSHRFTQDGNFLIKMSKVEWSKLGINESNADFVKVDEVKK